MTSKLTAVLALILTLALWAYFVWQAYASPVDVVSLQGRIAELSRAENAALNLDSAIAGAHLEWDADAPRLGEAESAWLQANRRMLSVYDELQSSPGMAAAMSRQARASERILAGLEAFRGVHRGLIEEFEAMRAAGEAVVEGSAGEADASVNRTIIALMEEIASYSLQADPSNRPTIETLLDSLTQQGLVELRDRVRLVMAIRDQQQSLLDELSARPLAPAVSAISNALLEHQLDQARMAQNNLIIVAVFGSGLLLVFGFIGLHLKASLNELDGVNANLEQLVEQRTAELNTALEDVKQHQLQLVQSEKMASLGQMAAGVAHEINTPLGYSHSNIESVIEWLDSLSGPTADSDEREELSNDIKALLQDTLHGIETISGLVMSLKNFSRVDRSSIETADIHDCINAALDFSRQELQDRIRVEKDYGTLPKVDCFPSKLHQVFLNIIRNAAEATEGDGVINISTRALEDVIEVCIKDTGRGMDADTAAHIFDPFFTTKQVGEGTGMGLSEAYRIMEEHGGRIRVDSAPGAGAEFVIELPLRPPLPQDSAAVSPDEGARGDAMPQSV